MDVIQLIFSIHSLGAAKAQPRTLRDRAAYQLLRDRGGGLLKTSLAGESKLLPLALL